jgi:hypothetical protein
MLDSLWFDPSPFAMVGFIIATERGDTIIQKQLVDKEVYYLNNIFDWKDGSTFERIGDAILETVEFKHENKLNSRQ